MHDLTPLHHPELCNAATLAYPELIRRALRRGAWVHTDSAFVAGEVVEAFGAAPDRVRVVAPGVPPLPAVAPGAWRAVVEPLLPEGTERFVLAVGTAEPRKDLPGLVRAFDELADRHADLALVLAGPPGWGEDALMSAIRQSRAGARVVRTGWLEPPELAALLGAAAVLAFPSLYEGFGFPPLEAMASGVPVVATAPDRFPRSWATGRRWSTWGIATGWCTPSTAFSPTRRSASAWWPPARNGRRRSAGSAVGPGWRSSIATWRMTAGADRGPPRVLVVVEQLRRAVPGGIGTFTRGLLGGLAQCGDEGDAVDVSLLASRTPGGLSRRAPADPLARFGRPLALSHLPGPLLTRAWDHGWVRAPRATTSCTRSRWPSRSPRGRRSGPVVTVHDLAWRRRPEAATARGRRGTRRRCAGPETRTPRWSSTSKFVAADLIGDGVDVDRITVVHGGSDHLPPEDPDRTDALLAAVSESRGTFCSPWARSSRARTSPGSCRPTTRARLAFPEPWPLVIVGPTDGARTCCRAASGRGWCSPVRSTPPSSPACTDGPGPSRTFR